LKSLEDRYETLQASGVLKSKKFDRQKAEVWNREERADELEPCFREYWNRPVFLV
jgi:hypothetical protein